MKTPQALLLMLTLSCGRAPAPTVHVGRPTSALLREQFSETAFKGSWAVVAPNVAGAIARFEDSALVLTMPGGSNDQIMARRKFDIVAARGQRLRLSARVRTAGTRPSFARATITIATNAATPSFRSVANSSAINSDSWTEIHTVIDVPLDATSGQLDLVLSGSGMAWFDGAEVVAIGAAPPPATSELSPQQIENLTAFTRAAALIRYLHPSDQAAALDWNSFLPAAIEPILHARSPANLVGQLRATFRDIAPTVTFSSAGSAEPPVTLLRGEATHLARWRRHGFGTSYPFSTYREGRDADTTSASASMRLALEALKTCKKVSLRVTGHGLSGSGKAAYFARVLGPGMKMQEVSEPVRDGQTVVAADIPEDTQDIEMGLRLEGGGRVTIDALTASCGGGPQRPVDIATSQWRYIGDTDLYAWGIARCGAAPCATLQRNDRETAFVPERDVLHSNIGDGIAIHVPLAVWADATRTLPAVAATPRFDDFTIDDAPVRLAAIAAAWGTLSIFYPYFADQHIDWLAALPAAFREAAAAQSPRETLAALSHLLVQLRDGHAKISHPGAPVTGYWPLAFRRFGDKVIVIGGVPAYLRTIKVGSELEAIDGVRALDAYDQVAGQVSAATPGWREYLTPWRLGMGQPGTLRSLRIRDPEGRVADHVVPLVSDDLYVHASQEARPAQGSDLAPGVYYLNLDSLSSEALAKLLPTLERARAIVLDFRGYVNLATLEVLSHLTDHELRSPTWQTPLIPTMGRPRYLDGHWDIRPQAPRLAAKIVALIDGRAISSIETALQIFHDNDLGVLVGETSAGTNGNVANVEVPGGFNIRFTALRASGTDGSTVQGRGFTPVEVAHPTLEGVRAGRDEILEAGVATARRLAGS